MLLQNEPRNIIFLCLWNYIRSQMVEGLARSISDQNFKVSSAGLSTYRVDPNTIEVMQRHYCPSPVSSASLPSLSSGVA